MNNIDTSTGDPTDDEIKAEPILCLFKHGHLPEGVMRNTSARFCAIARWIVSNLSRNPERTVSLRKLREAKDCAVTSHVWPDAPRT